MKIEDAHLEKLKYDIEKSCHHPLKTSKHFEILEYQMKERIGDYLSTTTLKRIWGYVDSYQGIRQDSLDFLARFLGYPDWTSYVADRCGDKKKRSSHYIITNALHVDDSILRKGGAETTAGWKFASPTGGRNALSVSLWEQFPTAASIPLSGKANGIAVLFCGTTNAMQLYVPNARLEVEYADGSKESVELVPPLNFDDFLHPAYQKDNDVFYIGEGTHALVQEIPLDSAKELKALHVEAIANEAIINILAVNLAR